MREPWRKHAGYDWAAFGTWVRTNREGFGWSLSQLAAAVQLNKGTLKHVEDGTRGLKPEVRERLVEVITSAAAGRRIVLSRREVLQLAGLAVGGALAAEGARPRSAPLRGSQQAVYGLVLDLADMVITRWDEQLYGGHAQAVHEDALHIYGQLLDSDLVVKEPDAAVVAMRVAARLARARETLLPWYDRPHAAIAVYDDVEARVIEPALRHFPSDAAIGLEYARLLTLRAPLYREIGSYDKSLADTAAGARLARRGGDLLLMSDLARNRAHIWAVQGNGQKWHEDLEQSQREIAAFEGLATGQLLSLAEYYQGEGYKRLAYTIRGELLMGTRMRYAQRAREHFARWMRVAATAWPDVVYGATVSGHPLLTRVSAAQCLVWLDADAALVELSTARDEAARCFPALLSKIDLATQFARNLLRRRLSEGAPVFNLDARYRR
jgi:hypothetical protein